MSVKPIPDGYTNVIPYLICKNADKVIDFCSKVFNAELSDINKSDEGKIIHAAIHINGSAVMLSDETASHPAVPTTLYIYAENCDDVYKKGIAAGGVSLREPTNEYYGDRTCGFTDPSGNNWWVGTHIEDVSAEETAKRMKQGK